MKRLLRLLSVLLLLAAPSLAHAHDFAVDGIYYNITSYKKVEVTHETTSYNSYSGSVTIPNTVTYDDTTYTITGIGYGAFRGCSSLTSVPIGAGVTTIGDRAFYNCPGLGAVYYSYNPTPPSCASSKCFSASAYALATLHVPSKSVSDYASATAWENFINIEDDIETAVARVSADAEEAQPTGYYSLSGQRLDTPAKGEVTIIRYSDGTARKVFMK